MASIRVLSGHGRYTDPWHPFAEGSAAIREILEAVGHRVEVRDDDVSCLQELDALDLVVVNLGGNVEVELEHDDEWAAAQHEFGQWIRGGGRVLAVHTAANSFPDWPEWPALLGGQWVRGTSWHPQALYCDLRKGPRGGGLSGLDWARRRHRLRREVLRPRRPRGLHSAHSP